MPDDEVAAVEPPRADDATAVADEDEAYDFDLPIEPGSPTVENALFVLLGVAMALAVVVRLVQLFG